MTEVAGWRDRLPDGSLSAAKLRVRRHLLRIAGAPTTKRSLEAYVERARLDRRMCELYEAATRNENPEVETRGIDG